LRQAISDKGGTTFPVGCTVEVMDPHAGSVIPDGVELLLGDVTRGERARALRAQLASTHPRQSAEQIEEAVQAACEDFVAQAETLSDPGAVYAWLRTVADRKLVREDEHGRHELPVDPTEGTLDRAASEEPGPAEELIALEDDMDLELLVREVADSLSGRRREVLALWGSGLKRPEIAAMLGIGERAVKRDLLAIMEEARAVVARRSGGGCEVGEPLVLRAACGIAAGAEVEEAHLHLSRCHRCAEFSERLEAWRQKAGALLPAPAAIEQASPGVLERLGHRVAHGISSVKQQILGGGAGLKQQAATGTYGRAIDPTPLVGIRPGPVVAVALGCLAVAGGGVTYCAQDGVDPLGAVGNLIAGTQEGETPPSPEPTGATEPAPVVPPPTPVTEEAVSQPTETGQPETTYTPEPKSEPEPEPQPEPEPEPEPEKSFVPSAPVTPVTSEEVVAEPATESTPTVKAKPTPAPSGDAPQFGGP
jgi:DNA-directed RNA polymerase specialized sigma24 family protein